MMPSPTYLCGISLDETNGSQLTSLVLLNSPFLIQFDNQWAEHTEREIERETDRERQLRIRVKTHLDVD